VLGCCSPSFRSNLFVGNAIHFVMLSLSKHVLTNVKSFDKLRMTQTKSIYAAIRFMAEGLVPLGKVAFFMRACR
jgi:hypothetical protein